LLAPQPSSSGLLCVQAPQARDALEIGVALDSLERLHGVLLVAALELRNAEQQVRLALVLQAALADALGERIGGLVVLLIAQVGETDADGLVAGGRIFCIRGGLGQGLLILLRRLLRGGEQALVLVL